MSNLLAQQQHKRPIVTHQKSTYAGAFGFLVLFATQSKCSFACANLFCQTFLHSNCASNAFYRTKKASLRMLLGFGSTLLRKANARSLVQTYFVSPSCTATAQATEAPTIGLLPMPIRPIISTCAGTEEEPANCASECILPIVSVMP